MCDKTPRCCDYCRCRSPVMMFTSLIIIVIVIVIIIATIIRGSKNGQRVQLDNMRAFVQSTLIYESYRVYKAFFHCSL